MKLLLKLQNPRLRYKYSHQKKSVAMYYKVYITKKYRKIIIFILPLKKLNLYYQIKLESFHFLHSH